MVTTIQVSEDLMNELKSKKLNPRESYEEIIWDLLEDSMELSEETRRRLKLAEKEVNEGKTISLSEVEKNLRL